MSKRLQHVACHGCASLLRQITETRANERRSCVGDLLALRVVPPSTYDDVLANHTLEHAVRALLKRPESIPT